MANQRRQTVLSWFRNQERIYGILCPCIVASLICWPLLNSICCLCLAGYWLVFTKKSFSLSSEKSRWVLLLVALYLVSIAGILYSSNRAEALFRLQQKLPILLFPLIFGLSAVSTPGLVRRSFVVLTWSTTLACIYCLANACYIYLTKGTTAQLYGYELVVLKDTIPYILGLYCLLSIIFLLDSLYASRRTGAAINGRSMADFGMLIFLSFFLLLLSNRSILIFFAGTVLYYCFRLLPTATGRVLLSASLVAVFTAALFLNPSLRKQWNEMLDFSEKNAISLDEDRSLGRAWGGKTLRVAIWKCSMDIIRSHWLTGVGTGDTQDALQQAYESRKFYFASRYNRYNAHNQYIQETLAHGIIGLGILISCIGLPLVRMLKAKENRLYALFLCCFAFICITESILELNKGIIWYSYFNAILLFKTRAQKSTLVHGTE